MTVGGLASSCVDCSTLLSAPNSTLRAYISFSMFELLKEVFGGRFDPGSRSCRSGLPSVLVRVDPPPNPDGLGRVGPLPNPDVLVRVASSGRLSRSRR